MGRVSIKVQRRYKPAASRNLVLPAGSLPSTGTGCPERLWSLIFSFLENSAWRNRQAISYRTTVSYKPPQSPEQAKAEPAAISHACYPSWGQQQAQHTGGLPQILLTAGKYDIGNLTAAKSVSDTHHLLSLSFSFAAVTFYSPISFPPLTNCSHHILFQDGTSQTAEKREMLCTRRWKATLERAVLSKEQRSHPFCPSNARALCNTSSNL